MNAKTLSSTAQVRWPNGDVVQLTVPSPAVHMAHNAVAAAAVGHAMGASIAQIQSPYCAINRQVPASKCVTLSMIFW